jgi:hypothetical protein
LRNKNFIFAAGITLLALLAGCSDGKENNTAMIGEADAPTSVYLDELTDETKDAVEAKDTAEVKDSAETKDTADSNDTSETKDTDQSEAISNITDEQALAAIKNYCFINNPDLEGIINEGEYPVYWDISSSDENEIVVVFRSYTGAQNRYYIDPVSGDTYGTELVPGIIDEEQRTEEFFNVRDYLVDQNESDISETYEITDPDLLEQYTKEDKLVTLVRYYEMTDGTWKTDEHTYKYRLEITGRMNEAAKDSTFVYLSNIKDISFERAYMAAGLSSNSDDYFAPQDAVLVAMK